MTARHDYIMASRQGLYVVHREECRRVADGYFFGVTVKGDEIYCFKTASRDAAAADANVGCVVRYEYRNSTLSEPEVVISGLHHNCHQVDFFDGAFFVVDTANNRILEFDSDWTLKKKHQIFPPAPRMGALHAHINSFFGHGDSIFVMFHNGGRGMPSEIVEFDRDFTERRRVVLPSTGCHDIVRLEDGHLLYCESFKGRIARDDGAAFDIDALYTRGLAVGPDEIAVGSSLYGERLARQLLPGFVTFLDRSFQRVGRLFVSAAPTQIRRLDGMDLSLSRPR
jgi:hypothetical protein